MSSVGLIKAPAWQGLSPGLPDVVELPAAEAERILNLVGLSGRLSGLRLESDEVAHYCVQPPAGPPLFLKLVKPAQRASVERAEVIASWLAGRGIPAAAAFDGYPRILPDGNLVVASAFIDGRRLRLDATDLKALGEAVARLHRALADHPERAVWLLNTTARLHELSSVRVELAAGRLMAGPRPDQLRQLADDGMAEFDLEDGAMAPLHGDLNPGNVLVGGSSPGPILLDFEDVFHSVLPPIFELALMLERFVLVRTDDDGMAADLGGVLFDAYRDAGGHRLLHSSHLPSNLLRGLSLRSLCVLALGARAGIAMADAEWNKFFDLSQAAQRRASFVDKIFEACLH